MQMEIKKKKKARITMLISYKLCLKIMTIARVKEGHYIIIKPSINP